MSNIFTVEENRELEPVDQPKMKVYLDEDNINLDNLNKDDIVGTVEKPSQYTYEELLRILAIGKNWFTPGPLESCPSGAASDDASLFGDVYSGASNGTSAGSITANSNTTFIGGAAFSHSGRNDTQRGYYGYAGNGNMMARKDETTTWSYGRYIYRRKFNRSFDLTNE